MLVPDSLTVHPDALDSKDPVFLAEPATIQLVIRNDPEEDDSDGGSEKPCDKEDNLPRFEARAVLAASDSYSVGDETAEDLREDVSSDRSPYNVGI